MRMLLGLSEALPSLVEAKFRSARATQSLVFSPTELTIIRTTTGVPFQFRYCPALAKKPEPQKEKEQAAPAKKPDPFDNPDHDLLIADIPTAHPTHFLVLNKFPIITEHFILVTKTNKQQTHILERDDLETTYACLKAWQDSEPRDSHRRLFAFFNSGEHSGASQPRRHLQFLPVENMKEDQRSNSWDVLIDSILSSPALSTKDAPFELLQHPSLPFAHFGIRLPLEPTGSHLLSVYNHLYQAARKTVDDFIAADPNNFALHSTDDGSLPISYNMAMTTAGMAILPRRSEGGMLRRDDGTDVGFIALNGTTLGGTLMVKHQEQWDVLRSQPEKLDSILEAISIPKTQNSRL